MTHASNDFHTVPQQYQDLLHSRIVQNNVVRIEEHLEAMQRDPHGLEFGPWKMEVDETWKSSLIESIKWESLPKEIFLSRSGRYGLIT